MVWEQKYVQLIQNLQGWVSVKLVLLVGAANNCGFIQKGSYASMLTSK